MSVVVIGLNHHTAPLELLERLTIEDARHPKALADVAGRDNISEAVVLSTCNRTEIYAVAERFHGAYRDIRDFLADWSFLPPEEFSDHLYVHYDDLAVHHLFGVAAGLDSAVLGEHEILGQVRGAWETALAEGTSGTQLNVVFRHAVEVGKRARTETAIARNIASVSTAAVAMAAQRLDSLEGCRVLVLGAGEMAEGMIKALVAARVADVAIANRTFDRAEEVADRVGGRAMPLSDLQDGLGEVDLLLTSTGASSLIIEHSDLATVVETRAGRPLLIVDVAVPRDVDPGAGELDGVTLLDMDDLRAFAESGIAERRREVAAVREILDEEVERFTAVASAREVAPLIAAMRAVGEEVRTGELERFVGRLGPLDDRQTELIDAMTKGLVAKLLHGPTVRLKDVAGTAKGERLAEALRDLFDL